MVVHTSVYRMLGIKGNHAEEFQKANIVIKVVSLEPSGKLKESLSFKPFTFNYLMQETWDTSWVFRYFSQTRFFFVAFQKQKMVHGFLKEVSSGICPYLPSIPF